MAALSWWPWQKRRILKRENINRIQESRVSAWSVANRMEVSKMSSQKLIDIAKALVANDKVLLAMERP